MPRPVTILAALVVLLGAASAFAQAAVPKPPPVEYNDGSTCPDLSKKGIRMARVSYVPFDGHSDPGDRRSTCLGATCSMHMRGWLYYPTGVVKNAKTIIYNHGHNQGRGEPCAIVRNFVPKGYVVFAPLRRGHFSNPPPEPSPVNWELISSTGTYIDDYADRCLDQECSGACPSYEGLCTRDALDISYLREQARQEVADQLAFVLAHPALHADSGLLADPRRVALFGHSYGGSLVVAANSIFLMPHSVAVAFSPAALSWNETWREALSGNVQFAWRPLYVLQPRNETIVKPTKVLPGVGVDAGRLVQGSLFPDAPWTPCDTDDPDCENEGKQAHGSFIGGLSQVKLWAPSVIEFMDRYPAAPLLETSGQ